VTTIYLIRHAYTGIPEQEQLPDTSLSPIGKKQAGLVAKRLSSEISQAGIIYSSTFLRAVQTAQMIAKEFGAQIKKHKSLDEIGVWTSPTQLHSPHISPREYEEELGILHRAQEQVIDFLEYISKTHHGEKIPVVTHGNVIRGIIAEALGAGVETVVRLKVDLASLSILEYEEKEDYFRLALFNDTSHL
jgi:probable phosphoglycerate mutase